MRSSPDQTAVVAKSSIALWVFAAVSYASSSVCTAACIAASMSPELSASSGSSSGSTPAAPKTGETVSSE